MGSQCKHQERGLSQQVYPPFHAQGQEPAKINKPELKIFQQFCVPTTIYQKRIQFELTQEKFGTVH